MANAAYDPKLSRLLASVESTSFWFRARNRLVASLLERYFPALSSVLEVGCGNGFVLAGIREAFPRARLLGVDLVDEALGTARMRVPDAEFAHLDLFDVTFEDEFDVVCALDVLEHIDDDREALRRMRRMVTPNGGVIVLVPQHPWLWSEADRLAQHCRRYTRRELVAKVRGAGLEVLFVSSFVTSLLPVMALSRLGRRAPFRATDLRRELDPGWLNGPFERMLDAERWLIASHGIPLPVGGSLLAVATRGGDGRVGARTATLRAESATVSRK